MARTISALSKQILLYIETEGPISFHDLYKAHNKAKSKKELYNSVYRLRQQGLIEELKSSKNLISLTPDGIRLIHKFNPKKDGIWKIIIFDIPEKKRYVRTVLRSKLESIGFKKWQNSTWVSPYALDPAIELELNELSKHYFVRLIKTNDINNTSDLNKLFPI